MKKKRGLSIFLVCCMLLMSSLNSVMASTDDVATGISMKKNMTMVLYGKTTNPAMKGYGNIKTLINGKLPENVENVKVTSSNKKVIAVGQVKHERLTSLVQAEIKLCKAGTAKIQFSGTSDGKKVTSTANIKVIKYKNPIKALKLNNSDYASKYKATAGSYTVKKTPGKYKVFCKAASGWHLKKIITIKSRNSKDAHISEYKNIKNNSSVKIEKGKSLEIIMELYNKKLNILENICIVVKNK